MFDIVNPFDRKPTFDSEIARCRKFVRPHQKFFQSLFAISRSDEETKIISDVFHRAYDHRRWDYSGSSDPERSTTYFPCIMYGITSIGALISSFCLFNRGAYLPVPVQVQDHEIPEFSSCRRGSTIVALGDRWTNIAVKLEILELVEDREFVPCSSFSSESEYYERVRNIESGPRLYVVVEILLSWLVDNFTLINKPFIE